MTTSDEDDEAIRKYCRRKGMKFKPWEIKPWDVDEGPCPYAQRPGQSDVHQSWEDAQRLREQILDELDEEPRVN